MIFNWLKITDLIKIENLIKFAQREIRNYSARKTSAEVRNENSAENISEHAQEILDTRAALDASTALLATYPAGSKNYKEEMGNNKKLDTRLYLLELDTETTNEEVLLKKEYSKAKTESLLAVAVSFEAGAQARKVQLQGG